nr:hypothetical protein [Tanacetum cinerariifolium]
MLNKDNYVPWSSRLLCYSKSKPNENLIYNSIMHGPYVKGMIPEPGDSNCKVRVAETFHEHTEEELTEKEVKKMEADDQAIQTILTGLPEDIYAAIDSSETAQEIWLHVQQMMKDSDIGIQEKMLICIMNGKGMNLCQDRHMQMVRGNDGNQFRQHDGHNIGNLNGYNVVQNVRNKNVNQIGNGNVVAARAEEIEEVNANCILMANLQQVSTSVRYSIYVCLPTYLTLPLFSLAEIMPPRMRTQSAGQPTAESRGGGIGEWVGRGGRGGGPKGGNNDHVDELNGLGIDQGNGTNRNVKGANEGMEGALDFLTIIA